MVVILVTGASGYVGYETATQLSAAGHKVYGLIRKQEEAKALLIHEITPVIGDITDIKSLEPIISKVSVIIDNVQLFEGSDPHSCNRVLLNSLQSVAEQQNVIKRYIYTSGCLVYGDRPNEILTEESPVQGLVKPRINFEQDVINNNKHLHVQGIVIRPAWIYGKSFGKSLTSWFSSPVNSKGEIEVQGKPNKIWSWIHVSDLARAYISLVEANSSVNGEIFNCSDSSRLTVAEAQRLCAIASGQNESVKIATVKDTSISQVAGNDFWSTLLNSTQIMKSDKLTRFTEWKPKHGPFQDEVSTLYQAWKAHSNK